MNLFAITVTCLVALPCILGIYNFGTFVAARLLRYKVDEFVIGCGPVLTRFQIRNTRCELRAFPVGGYVNTQCPRSSPRWMGMCLGGPVMLYLVGFLAAWLYFSVGYQEILPRGALVVGVPNGYGMCRADAQQRRGRGDKDCASGGVGPAEHVAMAGDCRGTRCSYGQYCEMSGQQSPYCAHCVSQ